jgi:hypothetical protein
VTPTELPSRRNGKKRKPEDDLESGSPRKQAKTNHPEISRRQSDKSLKVSFIYLIGLKTDLSQTERAGKRKAAGEEESNPKRKRVGGRSLT